MNRTKLIHSEAAGSYCEEVVLLVSAATALCSAADTDTGTHQAWPGLPLCGPNVSARTRLRFPACWDVLSCPVYRMNQILQY